MANVKLLKYDGTEQQYLGVERVQLATTDGGTAVFSEGEALEAVEITPDFSDGDMMVETAPGTLVKSAVIRQPDTLIPENVRRGITVAGVEGELIGDTEELTVDLNMANGDQIITPSEEGKVIVQVKVSKPDTLIPENIAKDVDIGGIIGALDSPDPVEKEITLDFSGGDMEVIPEDGAVFSKVNIPMPETLIPENIRRGISVAGVIGAVVAGKDVKVAGGKFSGTGDGYVLLHGLGVIPDVVAVITSISTGGYLRNAVGFSSRLLELTGVIYGQVYVDGDVSNSGNNICYIDNQNGYGRIYGANEETVTLWRPESGRQYYWLAIGGLT